MSRRLRAVAPAAAAVLLYLVLAGLAFWPVSPLSSNRIVGCGCSDAAQEVWFLAWPAYAIAHGANPFFSGRLEYPFGVNLALNTSMPLLGALSSPITWLAGPIAAFNLMLRLSFAASATSMLFVVRRLGARWTAAFAAGLLYGFSPYMVGEGFGHLFLTFVPLPPLICLAAYQLWRSEHPSWRTGLVIGLLCLAQLLISIEVLVTTVFCVLVVILGAALRHPRAAGARLVALARPAGAAVVSFAPLAAYPLWYFLAGPRHVIGPPHDPSNVTGVKSDLLTLVVPSLDQRLGPPHLIAVGSSFVAGDRPEIGGYLGVTLLALLVFLVWRYRRQPAVLAAAGLGITGIILSLGCSLDIDNHHTGVPLPFALLVHLPLLAGLVASRFSLYEQLGAAVVLGVGLDRTADDLAARRRGNVSEAAAAGVASGTAAPGTAPARLAGWLAGVPVLAVVVALLPLLPSFPYVSTPALVPGYFVAPASQAIPYGSAVLTYPYDVDPDNEAMLWQAVTGMRFAIFGGQASTPGADGRVTSDVAALSPYFVQSLFYKGLAGTIAEPETVGAPSEAVPAAPDAATSAAIRSFCHRYRVRAVVVAGIGDSALVIRFLRAAFGRPPLAERGAAVWYLSATGAAA